MDRFAQRTPKIEEVIINPSSPVDYTTENEADENYTPKVERKTPNDSRKRKFRSQWKKSFFWLTCKKEVAFCKLCQKSLYNILSHLKRHERCARHQNNLQQFKLENVTDHEEIIETYEAEQNTCSIEHLNIDNIEQEEMLVVTNEQIDYHSNDTSLKNIGDQKATNFRHTLKPFGKRIRTQLENYRDEWDIFGEFVTSELRGLKNEVSRKKLKRRIMEAILEVSNEDDGINININLI